MSVPHVVRIASSGMASGRAAVRSVLAALDPPTLAGAFLFCSSRYVLDGIAAEVRALNGAFPVIGCTTAGEITPDGPVSGTITGIGLAASDFTVDAVSFEDLDHFDPVGGAQRRVIGLVTDATARASVLGQDVDQVAILLIDGLACRAELITHTLQHVLGDIPLVGGAAGDDLAFRCTSLLHGGRFASDRAILAIVTSRRKLDVFRTHHHTAGAARAVITRSDPATRTVHELNGLPATEEYARLIGMAGSHPSPQAIARHPLMVRVGGEYFARSIQRIDERGSLILDSAIANGLVLRIGRRSDPVLQLRDDDDGHAGADGIEAVLAFESAQNRMETRNAVRPHDLYRSRRVVGFNTYGEQFKELHLNRSLVGLTIGARLPC